MSEKRYIRNVHPQTYHLVMNTQEKARELLAKDRQYGHEIQEKMVNRAVETEEAYEETLEEQARELLAQERQERQNLDDNMLSRSSEEIN